MVQFLVENFPTIEQLLVDTLKEKNKLVVPEKS